MIVYVYVCFNSDLSLAVMASHKKSQSGEKIDEVLRNMLRVLCSNAVPYGCQISIDALIGITVDSSEVILVNVHERLDKSGGQASVGSSDFGGGFDRVKAEPFDGAVVTVKSEQYDRAVSSGLPRQRDSFADTSEYPISDPAASGILGFGSGAEQFSDVIDVTECDDADELGYEETYNMEEEGQYEDGYQNEFDDDYLNNFGAGMPPRGGDVATGGMYNSDVKPFNMPGGAGYLQMTEAVTISSSRGHKQHGAANVARRTPHNPGVPRRQPKAGVKTEAGNYDEMSAPSSGISASEKTTVFTCSVCGKMIRHATSFQRHKQQHEGVVYRCDLCGAVLSRRDVLNAHRRKCEAKMMMQQSSDQFDAN